MGESNQNYYKLIKIISAMDEQKENTPIPLKEKLLHSQRVTNCESEVTICTAYELLRRGYIGARLKNEACRYADFIRAREAAGNPIAYPERYLSKWQIAIRNNVSPNEGAQIADFCEMWQCASLSVLCSIERVSVSDNTLQVWLAPGTTESEARQYDGLMRRADLTPILTRCKVQAVRWRTTRPEPICNRVENTMPVQIAEALKNLPPDPGEEAGTEFVMQADYLRDNHPDTWTQIVDHNINFKTWRTEVLFKQWIEAERNLTNEEKTPTARIEDAISEIVCAEADALLDKKTREFYQYFTRQ